MIHKWQRWTALPILIFAVLVVLLWRGLQMDPRHQPSALIGKIAPAFQLSDLFNEERIFNNTVFNNHVSVLHVWATWCSTCLVEHDTWVSIAKHAPVPIYGFDYKDDRSKAQQYLAQTGDPYTAVLFDGNGRAAIDWGVYGTPECYIIDQQGIVRYKHVGMVTPAVWQEEMLPLIKRLQQA